MNIKPTFCNGNCFCNCDKKVIKDSGPWYPGKTSDDRCFVESDDFTHDVRLYIDGDFGTLGDKMAYTRGIAEHLNSFKGEKGC